MANNMDKENKWREEFEAWENGEMDERLNELEDKYNNKTITREENLEYQKMLKILDNLVRIENISDYIDKLTNLKMQMLEEIKMRKNKPTAKVNAEEAAQKLEEELPKLLEEDDKLRKQLKNPNLDEKAKAEITQKLSNIKAKISQNNQDYTKYTGMINKKEKEKNEEIFSSMSDKELFDNAVKVSSKISVANLFAKQLMNGQQDLSRVEEYVNKQDTEEQRNNIRREVKKEIRKYTVPAKETEKFKEIKEALKGDKSNKLETEKIAEIEKEEERKRSEEVSKALVEVSEFDKKHPRLAAIKNWFSKGFKKIKDSFSYEDPDKKDLTKSEGSKAENVTEAKKEEKDNEESIEDKRKEFLKTLKDIDSVKISDVAEKGTTRDPKKEKLLRNKLMKEKEVDQQSVNKLIDGMDEATVKKIQEEVNNSRKNDGEER